MTSIRLTGPVSERGAAIASADALEFVALLDDRFSAARADVLAAREARQSREFDRGELPGFAVATTAIREGDWKVAAVPADLDRRWVEITGPVERKMMINALNSGADVFMADFEDSLSPTWTNVVEGQVNLFDAVRRALRYESPDGKEYRLADSLATLVVRPRGWHLVEKHAVRQGGARAGVSASLFDFGLYFFHNARELRNRGSGPYF
ncbi:MAG TPA: malate synthase A, partial [Polyangiaceae bacterium]|nr:malate synthase A [Polyangiaceae bacterium]